MEQVGLIGAVKMGDIDMAEGTYDIILANINRNVLLNHNLGSSIDQQYE